jgi:hypothetical protein
LFKLAIVTKLVGEDPAFAIFKVVNVAELGDDKPIDTLFMVPTAPDVMFITPLLVVDTVRLLLVETRPVAPVVDKLVKLPDRADVLPITMLLILLVAADEIATEPVPVGDIVVF